MFKIYKSLSAHTNSLWRDLKQSAMTGLGCVAVVGFIVLAASGFGSTVPQSLCATPGTVFTTFTADIHC